MRIRQMHDEAVRDAIRLVTLYDSLITTNKRRIRPEWANRFAAANLVPWGRRGGLWRSRNDTILIVGSGQSTLSHHTFTSESLSVFLRSALVQAMAAVDKVLHEAISKHFVSLARTGELDKMVEIDLSKVYQIAQAARVRTGRGGRVRSRPGHRIKAAVLEKIYTQTYLSLRSVDQVCAACGKKAIFSKLVTAWRSQKTANHYRERWSRLYRRRNQIAHECDIVRQAQTRLVRFHRVEPAEIKRDITFVIRFGRFLARELD